MALSPEDMENIRPPSQVEDLGLPIGLVEDLFMRRLLTERATSISEASKALCITHAVGTQLAESLRDKALVEYLGATGRDYRIQLTELGYQTTTQRMTTGRHVGSMPVPLDAYVEVVKSQQSEIQPNRELLAEAFSDLVLEDGLLDQIGPAFVSGGAIFLYGPAGTGKTSLAERLNRIFDDPVLIPRYIEVDGQIISVYDPSMHMAVPDQPEHTDPRWVLCERPLIVVGGELDLAMLDLGYDRVSGINSAPVQLLANNGILVVDDFGRQAIRPEQILNRWIVPLSRGVDYLKANTGTKFTVPFELKLVISTNLDPNSLGDDAFLRRLRNKVFVGAITDEAFGEVLANSVESYEIELMPDATDYLCEVARREIGELRPYLAVDFCQLVVAICDYEQVERVLDPDMIERVADLYFVQSEADEMSGPQLDIWRLPALAVAADVSQRGDYEVGYAYADPLAGLEALAATQSIDDDHVPDGIPAALQPTLHPT